MQTSAHILIVDEYQSSLVMQHIFSTEYNVTCVHDDQAALTMLDKNPVDAVLIDITSPTVNGLQLLQSIKHQQKNNPAVIMLATQETWSQVPYGFQLGAHDYINKPIERTAALTRVKAQLTMRRQITERDTRIAELEATVAQLQAEKDAQRRMVRMITHDLKHPLSNIRMAEGLLRYYTNTDPTSDSIMDSITAALESMQEVIEDFSDAYQLKGGVTLSVQPTSLGRVLNELGLEFLAHATRKSITIDVEPCEDWVAADPSCLRRALGNLLSNAVKYSPPQTNITVTTKHHTDQVRVVIADEGPGVSPTELGLLYTEFGKLSTQPTGQESSTGLGLWIVKMLVEAMNGTVGYEDAPAGGGRFWLQLPIAAPPNITTTERITDEIPKVYVTSA